MRKAITIFFSLLVLILVGVVLAAILVDLNQFRQAVGDWASERSGYQIRFLGEVNKEISSTSTLDVTSVEVRHPERESTEPPLLHIEQWNTKVVVKHMMGGSPFWAAYGSGVEITLIEDQQGNNWQVHLPPRGTNTSEDSELSLDWLAGLQQINLRDIRIHYISQDKKEVIVLDELTLENHQSNTPGEVILDLLLTGAVENKPLRLEGSLTADNSTGVLERLTVDLKSKLDENQLDVAAQVAGKPLASSLDVSIVGHLPKPESISSYLPGKIQIPANLEIRTDLSRRQNQWNGTIHQLELGNSQLTGRLQAVLGEVNQFSGDLLSNQLDVDEIISLFPDSSRTSQAPTTNDYDPKTWLDWTKGLGLNLTVKADEIHWSKLADSLVVQTELAVMPGQLQAKSSAIQLGEDSLEADLTLKRQNDRLQLSGAIGGHITPMQWFSKPGEPGGTALNQNSEEQVEEEDKRMFSDQAINWSWLNTLEMDLRLDLQTLQWQRLILSPVTVPLMLSDGVLKAPRIYGETLGGTFNGGFNIAHHPSGAQIDAQIEVREVRLQNLLGEQNGDQSERPTDVQLKFSSVGQSVADIMGTLNGSGEIQVRDAAVLSSSINWIGSDVILQLLRKLNPFDQESEQTLVECGRIEVIVEDGQLRSEKLIVETDKVVIVGDAEIDFKSESLKLAFNPKARESIGVNLGKLVQFVGLGGTLSNPVLSTSAEGLAKTGATVGAALTTGGLSLLAQGLLDRAKVSAISCDKQDSSQAPKPIIESETNR